jgi:hypothetical protein
MWQLFLEQLLRDMQRPAAKHGVKALGLALMDGLNKPEAYVDRIQRDFRLRDWHQARAVYEADRAYWENLYGSDPLNSPNHPASPPKSLLPHQPGAPAPGYNFLNPAQTDGNAFGRFGNSGEFVPGPATSSRPLYETQQIVSPPDTMGEIRPGRRLARVGNTANTTPFDSGALPVPFVSPNPILESGRPATIEERSQLSMPPGMTSADDLEAFRRQWFKTYMEP